MSPHGEQPAEQEVVHRPAKVKLETPDDVVDTKNIQWRPPSPEAKKQRLEDRLQNARDLVEARIKTGADMVEFQNQLADQLLELVKEGYGLFADRQETLLKENKQKKQVLEEQFRTIASFDGRQQALAELAAGHEVQDLIKKAEDQAKELQEQVADMEDADAEVFYARKINAHKVYMDVLHQIEKDPGSVDAMRKKQQDLLETRLKNTGSIGGSHEDVVLPTNVASKKTGATGGSHEVITKMGEPSQESVEARQQRLLEKKWMILRQEQQDAEAEYAELGFIQKWFGEKGKMLKTKLARIKADQTRVYKQILPARQKKLGTEFEQMARAMRKE